MEQQPDRPGAAQAFALTNARLLLLSASLVGSIATAAPTTEIVPLRHAAAENVLPAIEPFLLETERASVYGNQLVLRAEPERLLELQRLVSDLDQQPVRLRISVASSSVTDNWASGHRVDGRIGGPVDIVVGDPSRGNQTRIIRRQTRGSTEGVRQITTNAGHPVFIHQGQSVPLETTTTNTWGQTVEQTRYRDVVSGFYATVRLSGDVATIEISTRDDRLNSTDSRTLDIRRADSVISTRLGEWVTIGNLTDADVHREKDTGRRTTTRRDDAQSVRIMVERL